MSAVVTRFDTTTRPANEAEGLDEREVVRFFDKRKLVGEFDIDDISREDWEETLPEFVKNTKDGEKRKVPVALTAVLDFLGEEATEEDEEDSGSIVPTKYRIRYGAPQNCGDEVAIALTTYVTLGRATKKNPDGGLDREKLAEVCRDNGLSVKLNQWTDRGLNGGLLRMNTSNVLRGMVRRGETVKIGSDIWNPKPVETETKAAAPKRTRKAK